MTAASGRVRANTVLGRQGARLGFRPRDGESWKSPQVRCEPSVAGLRIVISAQRHFAQIRGRVTQRADNWWRHWPVPSSSTINRRPPLSASAAGRL